METDWTYIEPRRVRVGLVAAGTPAVVAAKTTVEGWQDKRTAQVGGVALVDGDASYSHGEIPSKEDVWIRTLGFLIDRNGAGAVPTAADIAKIAMNTRVRLEHVNRPYDLGKLIDWLHPSLGFYVAGIAPPPVVKAFPVPLQLVALDSIKWIFEVQREIQLSAADTFIIDGVMDCAAEQSAASFRKAG